MDAQASAANPENKPILLGRDRRHPEDPTMDFLQHFLCTLFYMLEWTLFFLLVLVVVGFNIWNLLAALVGLTLGYLFFGKGRVN